MDFQTKYKKQVKKKKIVKFDYIVINNFYLKKKNKNSQAKPEGKLQTMKTREDICDLHKWKGMKI